MTAGHATLRTDVAVVELLLLSAGKNLGEGDFSLKTTSACPDVNLGPPQKVRLFSDDITRMANYLDAHIEGIREGTVAESMTYVPLELAFQMRAMDGEVESGFDGYFTISFATCRYLEGNTRAYYGFEGVVDMADSKRFSQELRELETAVSTPAG